MEQDQVLYEGTPVKLGGKEYIVAPLSFGQIERLTPVIERLHKGQGRGLTPALMRDMATVIHAAMSRNYPDLTVEEVKDMLDTRNSMRVVAAIMGVSGFEEGSEGERKPVV